MDEPKPKTYRLLDPDGVVRESTTKGTLGGYRRGTARYYGRLDCPSAARFIARGHYVRYRVFFEDEPTAIAAGHRPCARCRPEKYRAWKAAAGAGE